MVEPCTDWGKLAQKKKVNSLQRLFIWFAALWSFIVIPNIRPFWAESRLNPSFRSHGWWPPTTRSLGAVTAVWSILTKRNWPGGLQGFRMCPYSSSWMGQPRWIHRKGHPMSGPSKKEPREKWTSWEIWGEGSWTHLGSWDEGTWIHSRWPHWPWGLPGHAKVVCSPRQPKSWSAAMWHAGVQSTSVCCQWRPLGDDERWMDGEDP